MTKKKSVLALQAVPQQHPLGCAVACVATRCGLSYPDAFALFSHPEHAWTRGYYCNEVVDALAKAGWKYSFAKFKPSLHERKLTMSGTIIFVEPCQSYPAGHFFVRAPQGWMNPWANFPLMNDIQAEFQEALPGNISYIIFG